MIDCDLHIHSIHSDGAMCVKDIIYYAKKTGLKYIAISDHDTMHGVPAAIELGRRAGIQVVPAVETTAVDTNRCRAVHILGYYPKYPDILKSFLSKTLMNRKKQKLEMIKKIQALYPMVELEHIERYSNKSQSIYESHIMQTLCDLGYTNTAIGSLMDELISKRGSCYVPSHYPSVKDVVDTMNRAKAVIVIAHPEQFDSFDLADELAGANRIHGLELDHPRNHRLGRERIWHLSEKYGLILTGGSDFHGFYAKHPKTIGSHGCSENVIKQMKELAKQF